MEDAFSNIYLRYRLRTLSICIFFSIAFSGYSQNDLQNWNSLQLTLSILKKLDVRLSHLRAYNISNGYSSDFNQSSVRLDYDFTKRFSMSGGAVLGSLSAADGANRIVLRGTYRIPIADVINWSNSIQGEIHSSNETRYRNRVVYITRVGTQKRLEFLRLSPSVAYSLYYNIGGNQIQYFDKTGIPTIRQSPDGFHRGRLSINMNSKISKTFSLTLYYMMQREFNLFSNEYHKMNVVNPATGKVIRPFDDYNVIGTTLALNFDVYKKKNRSDKTKNSNL